VGESGWSQATVGAVAGGSAGLLVAAAALVALRCRRRPGRRSGAELGAETTGAYTLSIEDALALASECGDLTFIEARPPVLEESDGALFGPDGENADGLAVLARAGKYQPPVVMRSLLGQL
jgi:hypothetical protein